jgi:hydrogenase maturation protease
MMKKIAILGLGDVLQGDRGAACYVLESVANETAGKSVHISYLGDDPRYAGGLLYKTDLAIIVGTLRLSGVPGGLHVWNGKVFRRHATWLAGEDPAIDRLLAALARADLAGGFPEKLVFIWIEPKDTHGCKISEPVRRAIAMAVRRIRKELRVLGLLELERRQELVTVAPELTYMD